MKWHIVSDSSCDIFELPKTYDNIDFTSVPFTIHIGETEFVDDGSIDVDEMLKRNENSSEAGQTACPAPQHWLEAFEQPGPVIAFTISKGLSGSYNSACTAREMVLEKETDKHIAIIDTRSTGPELVILIRCACDMIESGHTIMEIEAELNRMAERTHIVFALSSYRNLIKAGRVSKLVGVLAGHLGIWGLGIGDDNGKIAMRGKARGVKGMIRLITEEIRSLGISNGTVIISHSMNEDAAQMLKTQLKDQMENLKIEIIPARGLDSFYAERKGLIVAF